MKLLFNALSKFLLGVLLVGTLLFLPAGSFNYLHGWLFILVLFVPMLILGVVLFIKSPELLSRRLNTKEKEKTQMGVVGICALVFIAGFVVAGLDFRYGWSDMHVAATIVGAALFICSYALYAEVMRENTYLLRTVDVEAGQKIIDTGLYGIVRHPMYSATVVMFTSIPLILGSWWAFICFVIYIPVIAVRILNEEKVLKESLAGYTDYIKKVKYRLIPFVW